MPSWGEILTEFQESARQRNGQADGDGIRLKYIKRLHHATGRAVIVYATAFLSYTEQTNALFVEGADVHGLMEVCHGVTEKKLDLVLHSPGGSPQAAEQMVEYLRTRFDHIRAIIPLQAKSAATMIALGADEIVMGAHSEVGPVDPQIAIPTPEGYRFAPAHGLLRDFEKAKEECAQNVGAVAAWTPILRSYVGLLEFSRQQVALSIDVVAGWLERYMLRATIKDDAERKAKAQALAEWFGSDQAYVRFRSHSRPVRLKELASLGLTVTPLEKQQTLQDAVLSVLHASELTLREPVAKIIENHNGKRKVTLYGTIQARLAPKPPEKAPEKAPEKPEKAR